MLRPGIIAVALVLASSAEVLAQGRAAEDRPIIEFRGCVSLTPSTTGEFIFVEASSGSTFRLVGKRIKDYAGRRVAIVADSEKKRLRFRFGLWPSPNIAGQASAIDPVQAAIARAPGGAAAATDPANLPELRVSRMRRIEGGCGA